MKVIVFVTGEDVLPLSDLGDYLEFSFVFLSIIVHLFQACGRLPLSTSPRQNETPDALPAKKILVLRASFSESSCQNTNRHFS